MIRPTPDSRRLPEGRGPWMARVYPDRSSTHPKSPPHGGVFVSGGEGRRRIPSQGSTDSPGANQDSRRLPEGRGPWMARVYPDRSSTHPKSPPHGGVFVSGGEGRRRIPSQGSTDSPGANQDSRRLPEGRGPWMARAYPDHIAAIDTHQPHSNAPAIAFAYLAKTRRRHKPRRIRLIGRKANQISRKLPAGRRPWMDQVHPDRPCRTTCNTPARSHASTHVVTFCMRRDCENPRRSAIITRPRRTASSAIASGFSDQLRCNP